MRFYVRPRTAGLTVILISFGAAAALLGPAPIAADDAGGLQSYVETIPESSVAIEMIALPAGEFLMGSPPGEVGREDDEGPQFRVGMKAFWMSKCEIPWDAYDLYWRDEKIPEGPKPPAEQYPADALTRPTPPYSDETFGHGREGHPCLGMSHHAAMMFCRWLSKKTGKSYRLPTEAEWEYACRAGTTTAYPFGDDPKGLADHAWFADNSDETTHPLKEKSANAWGLHDMLGNVAEWCLDLYSPTDYAKYPADRLTLRPVRKPGSVKFSHCVRGGSWADAAAQCRSASRRGSNKDLLKRDPQRPQSIWWLTEGDYIGIRLVRAAEEHPELENLLPPVNWDSPNGTDE